MRTITYQIRQMVVVDGHAEPLDHSTLNHLVFNKGGMVCWSLYKTAPDEREFKHVVDGSYGEVKHRLLLETGMQAIDEPMNYEAIRVKAVTVITCPICRGTNVARDAAARWSVKDGIWELSCVHDDCTCNDCGVEIAPVETEVVQIGIDRESRPVYAVATDEAYDQDGDVGWCAETDTFLCAPEIIFSRTRIEP